MRSGLPIIGFDDAAAFDTWLATEPRTSKGLWLKLAKKAAKVIRLSKAEAIDAALCRDWIDGQLDRYDEARRVLWYAGLGMILSTWVMQAILYGSWPATPAAWLVVGCVLLRLPHPLLLLNVVALVQALGLAAYWNLFLTRSPKVEELYSDANGQDWRIYWREFEARAREKARGDKLRRQSWVRP